jgi:hypothetical protein
VSRERVARAQKDLFSRHSERIARALELGTIDYDTYAVLSFLIDKIDLPGRNGELLCTLEEFARRIAWPHTIEPLRRRLHGLRDAGAIDFDDPRRGPGAPWVFRLSGAAVDGEWDESLLSFHQRFLAGRPTRDETISAQPEGSERENLDAERGFEPSEFPRRARAEQSRAEILSDEKLDHVLSKTTARVRVEQAEDGSFVWNGEPQEGEQGLLDDCQALADAGLARWREVDDGSERR